MTEVTLDLALALLFEEPLCHLYLLVSRLQTKGNTSPFWSNPVGLQAAVLAA